jgi:hypothetical protein
LVGSVLNSTAPTSCVVFATSAASTNYLVATSAPKTFTFTAAPQPTLTIGNTVLSGPAGTAITIVQSGGAGNGTPSIRSTTTGCTVVGMTINRTTSLGTCAVTTTRAASGIYAVATSSPQTFTFTAVAQATLTITNAQTVITKGATGVALTTTGGSGTGAVTYVATGTGCVINGSRLSVAARVVGTGTCSVVATKAAQGIYAISAPSAAKIFTY